MNLVEKIALEKQALVVKQAGKDGKEDVASIKGSKLKALELKTQSKHPVWHAYRMYSDPENLAREWLIHDVTKPVQDWYHHQCLQLRGVQKSFDWAASQCQGSYWNHILAVLKVLDGSSHFCRWGIILHVDEDRLLICILTEHHR